ncbi:MAG: alpha/beta hydrolase, partial [Clostridia bacterium]|nr:alpha/beta hydrolase [Clostridia bacterium]
MPVSAKTMRARLAALKPFVRGASLGTIRRGQNLIGELMEWKYRSRVRIRQHVFEQFVGAWVTPRDERRQGVILYLHGGGYTCGDVGYATGFGATLAAQNGVRVFCPAYRLAPEHPFPAALEDAVEAYRYLLQKGYPAHRITLCGESAGGGLCYALCLRLKELSLPLPCGIVAISPWTDLTASGASYQTNRATDPSISEELLDYYAENYADDRADPLVSPLFADLSELPPSLIFVGGDEIMLDDATQMHEKLLRSDCRSELIIAPERWHGYLLYGLDEDRKDMARISQFLNRYM